MQKQNLISMLQGINIDIDSVHNVYQYGSRVYDTNTDESDYDFIVVGKSSEPILGHCSFNVNCTQYNVECFNQMVKDHEISILECLFLPDKFVIKEELPIDFELDLPTLRKSISTKASHSFVKAKKKLIVEKDYDRYAALKSLFHSFRIIEFGIQIAKYGKIIDYTAANHYFIDIFHMDKPDWNKLKSIYKPLHNKLMTEFRKLAPKEL